ncbi:uncharacterized protein LOC116400828 [Anarrhichthys ocellatus]|uniref:uncharacterized protein LOC116400828 n=1 Tax=Anarrhichthys ocellatus TaxID=433405 RepID=UPI0012EE3B9A|nr:uncharacterized protein LOC116400828 [Anarrhichthys ocellatus]
MAAVTETWRRHIVGQLKHRDLNQHHRFQDLIRFYIRLLEKTSLTKGILSCSVRCLSSDRSSVSSLLHQKNNLKKTTGELAYQVLELQQQIQIKECVLEEQHARLVEDGSRLEGALDARRALQQRVETVQEENGALKRKYDELLELQRREETKLREETVRGEHLLEDLIHLKTQAAAHMNSHNQRRSRYLNLNAPEPPHTPQHTSTASHTSTIDLLFSLFVSRVFKKASPNGKLTVYLGKRDFVDHVDLVEPVDGVVLIDPEYLKERKVFVTLTCAFRYGREDLDVLGLTFRKDLFVANVQAFPPPPEEKKSLTRLQERLIKKLGEHAHPFTFEIPLNLPCSVTLQPGPEDTGKACGVDFEVKAFCAENVEEKIHKR